MALDWIKNYFCNRLQYVEYNGTCSSFKDIICGVPQGSILGPLFFLIYINDLWNVSNIFKLVLFADDTSLFFSHKDLSILIETVNVELSKLSEWFKANNLSIDVKKSNYLIFKPRQKRQTFDLDLEINNHKIDHVKEVVFLGVVLDEHLSWTPHISHVAGKISKSIGIINKSSFYLSKFALRTLYCSLVYTFLQYCITVWGSTYLTNLNRIILLQKRIIRIIDKKAFDAHTNPIFKELKILKFESIYLFHLGKFMYAYKTNLLPRSFDNFLLRTYQVHTNETRSLSLFYVPFCRTNIRQFSIHYQGSAFFNTLSSDIRDAPHITSFLSKLKRHLLFCS